MRKPILKVIQYGGYPFEVLVAIGARPEQIVAKLQSLKYTPTADEIGYLQRDHREGGTVQLANHACVMILNDVSDDQHSFALLAHEAFHAVNFLMKAIGMSLSDDSEEAYAYAIQDLVTQIAPLFRK